jgi:cytochrome c peroxidase
MTLIKVSWLIGLMTMAAGGASIAAAEDRKPDDDLARLMAREECGAERCIAVARGLFDFFDRRLHGLQGNGRACADCHMAADRFQLSPASAEARYQALQQRRLKNPWADDPLFRPVDANDYRVNGDNATDYTNLREHALIRVTLPLPGNVQLIDPSTGQPSSERSVDVWRAVPTVINVKLTGPDALNPWARDPNPSGGYQLDARFGSLQEQALGALQAHAEIQVAPPQRFLDDLSAFQAYFSRRVACANCLKRSMLAFCRCPIRIRL